MEHGSDVLLSQRGGRAGFAHKTFAGIGALPSNANLNDLQCNFTFERRVNGTIRYPHPSAPKLVKTSILMPLDLINSEALFVPGILRDLVVGTDSNPQQTNHAAESATGCFIERAAADRTCRNFSGCRLHLFGLSCGHRVTQVPQFLVHLRGFQDGAVHFFTQNYAITLAQSGYIAAQSRDWSM